MKGFLLGGGGGGVYVCVFALVPWISLERNGHMGREFSLTPGATIHLEFRWSVLERLVELAPVPPASLSASLPLSLLPSALHCRLWVSHGRVTERVVLPSCACSGLPATGGHC